MKKAWLLGSCLMLMQLVVAQQLPLYTQNALNGFLFNPALAGIENYIDVKTGYRKQWQGIEGAPQTTYFSIQGPLGKGYSWSNAGSFSAGGGTNPMSRSYLQEYQAAEPHHGLGISGVFDNVGPLTQRNLHLSYAYHLGLAPKLNLALGISPGINLFSIDRSKINLANDADAALASQTSNQLKFQINTGLWLYSSRFFAGISALQINRETNTAIASSAHFYGTVGYKTYLSDNIVALPSVVFVKAGPAALAIDFNTKLAFQDKFWIAGTLRREQSFSVMSGFYLNHFFNLGYAYDFGYSSLQKLSNGSHEIVLGFLLNNQYRVSCPQRNW